LTPWRGAGERGRSRANEGAGGKQRVFPLPIFADMTMRGGLGASHWLVVIVVYAAFGVGFAVGCATFLAFSLAANSCRTLRPIASVSTL